MGQMTSSNISERFPATEGGEQVGGGKEGGEKVEEKEEEEEDEPRLYGLVLVLILVLVSKFYCRLCLGQLLRRVVKRPKTH